MTSPANRDELAAAAAASAARNAPTPGIPAGNSLLQAAQYLVHIQASHDVAIARDLHALFDVHSDTPGFADTVHLVLPELIDQHAQASSLIAAQWYDDLDVNTNFVAKPYADVSPEQIDKSINWALYAPGEERPVDRLTGSTQRLFFQAAPGPIFAK